MDQLRREARKGRKWPFVEKGKDRQQGKRNWGASPHVLSTPRSGWEAIRLSQKTPLKLSGARSGALSFFRRRDPPSPPNVELGGLRSCGERTHFPIPGRTPRLRFPAGRSILTWGSRSHRRFGCAHNQNRRSHGRSAPSWGRTPAVPSRFVIELW